MILRLTISLFLVFQSIVFGIDKNNVIDELSNQTYSIEDNIAGVYKLFDPSNKLWFLYMPKLKYLLIHKTGKNRISDGAVQIPFSEFTSIKVENGSIIFGDYTGSNLWASQLANKSFSFDGEMAGMYNKFDSNKDLWFLYMPKLRYLLIHETGKYKTSDGAITIDVSNFKAVNVNLDPFGNNTGSITFVGLDPVNPGDNSGNDISISNNNTSEEQDLNNSNSLEMPPSIPNIEGNENNNSTGENNSDLQMPPSIPSLN